MRCKLKKTGFLLAFLLLPWSVFSETFKWVDKEGEIHFADDFLKIPSEYRSQVDRKNEPLPVMEKKEILKPEEATEPSHTEESAPAPQPIEEPATKNEEVVTVLDKITPGVDDKGNAVFTGRIKNNSEDILSSVEIIFNIESPQGMELETVASSIKGELEGTLKGGETGSFSVRSQTPINSMGAFKYNVKWKSFGK